MGVVNSFIPTLSTVLPQLFTRGVDRSEIPDSCSIVLITFLLEKEPRELPLNWRHVESYHPTGL